MDEIWKDIEGYEGLYQASSFGRVRSMTRTYKQRRGFRTTQTTILNPWFSIGGYLVVGLCRGQKIRQFKVHRLVCSAFHPNPHKANTVNHKNKDRVDNRIENLEWMTTLENNRHSAKLSLDTARMIRALYGKGVAQRKIARELCVSPMCVNKIVHNKTWIEDV